MLQLAPVHITLQLPPESRLPMWITIVATALISSLFTALITEPLKVYISNRSNKRQLLRSVLAEASCNYSQLQNVLDLLPHRTYTDNRERDRCICNHARAVVKTTRYDAAKESALFFWLGSGLARGLLQPFEAAFSNGADQRDCACPTGLRRCGHRANTRFFHSKRVKARTC